MGLDISAYRQLVEVTCTNKSDCEHVTIHQDKAFAGREAPLTIGACYVSNDGADALRPHMRFRAGSYSGYNAWRDELSRLALGMSAEQAWVTKGPHDTRAFIELINFSDCDGVIGEIASAKLAADFATYDARAKEAMATYHYEKYAAWRTAFELAADGGAVLFR